MSRARPRSPVFVFAAVAVAIGLCLCSAPSRAQPDALPGRYTGACREQLRFPIALAVYGDEPIVFGAANVVEPFAPGVSGDGNPQPKICHVVTGIVGAAIASQATFYLAEPHRVDRMLALAVGGSYVPSAIVASADPNDRIEAIATNRQDQIEVVVSTGGNPARPRFLLFDRLAKDAAMPLRSFTSSRIDAAVSAVAFDARGELYAYDDGGRITEFRSNASGSDPEAVRTIAGPLSLLRPALVGSHGTRPLVVDTDGTIVAADDRLILTYASDAAGDAPPVDVITAPQIGIVNGVASTRVGSCMCSRCSGPAPGRR